MLRGNFIATGGTIQNDGRFIMANGRAKLHGNRQLGVLVLTNSEYPPYRTTMTSTLEVDPANSAVIRFRDSRTATWDANSFLEIRNWNGTTNGGTAFKIYVGSNAQGLTAAQLRQITFANPGGFPAGVYIARILSTGELVPKPGPSLTYAKSGNRLVLNWPNGYSLMTSTNVTGPWNFLTAVSPYTNSFSGPRRFFLIRSP